MKETPDYKEDVRNTRIGGLGGSDAELIKRVAENGSVPQVATILKRLAICKGIVEKDDDITTRAMQYGDFIEQSIYDYLSATNKGYQSNPLWVSKKYSKKNVRLLCHVDFLFADEKTKVLHVYECKATKSDYATTRKRYEAQMFIEYSLGKEVAKEMGGEWSVKMHLVHYSTKDVNLDEAFTFDVENLTIKSVNFKSAVFDIDKGMSIINDFLETYDEYRTDDEIPAEALPTKVKAEFDYVTGLLREIKERENIISDFKTRLFDFMCEKNIKGIKCEDFTITRIDATTTKSFDSKKYVEALKAKHPRKAKKIIAEFTKETHKRGYVSIKTK